MHVLHSVKLENGVFNGRTSCEVINDKDRNITEFMLIKLIILSLLLVAIAIVFLGIRILLKSNGKFPDTHVGHNREMQKRGIKCAQETDTGCVPSEITGGCMTCGKRIL